MVKIKKVEIVNEIDIVDMETFRNAINELRKEIEQIKISSSPKVLKNIKDIGKKSVKIEDLKPKKEKSPIEELLEE
jgi:pyruvate/2-oxoglutarate dehydrogenase complex dihydrolipoamide acyltransferase (E2) component